VGRSALLIGLSPERISPERSMIPAVGASTMRAMRLLRLRDFRLLVLSNGLSSLGDELALIALTIKVFDASHGSGPAVAAVLLAGILPLVVFAPLSGLIVDRTETTGTLAVASAIQAAIAVALAFARPVWLIVLLCFLLGSAASVASPAVLAIVPKAVDEEDLTAANANMETARYVGMVLGPILAVAFAKGALLVDAITFLIITSAAASLTVRRPPEPAPEGGRPKGEARKGFTFLRRDRVLLITVSTISLAVFFGTIDSVAEVFFARDPALLNAGNWGYGGLAAAWLVGMVIGAGVIARRLSGERLAPAVVLASVGGGAAVAIAAGFPAIGLALAMFVLGGIANGVAGVSMRSLIHHRTPGDLRGRVFAAFFALAFAGQVAATALGGVLLVTLPSAKYVLLVGGVGSMVIGLVGLAWLGALPTEAREPSVVVVPEAEPAERAAVVLVRDITPAEDPEPEPAEVLPSAGPSA
jgi:MFS family permease